MDHGGNANVIALALRCYNRDDITFSSMIPPVPLSHTNKVVHSFFFFARERPSLPQIGRNAPSIPDCETRAPWPGSPGTDRRAAFHQPRAQSDVFDSGQAGMMNEAARMMDVDEGRMA
jgi:hypothetical protein